MTPAELVKRKVIYREKYGAPGFRIKQYCLPSLPSATGFTVAEAYLLEAGAYVGGEEYQVIRMVLRTKAAGREGKP